MKLASPALLLLSLVAAAGAIVPLDSLLLAQGQDDRGIQHLDPRPLPPRQNRRVALVVGNSEYTNISALRNPRNDARTMTNTLQDLGFDRVISVYDASLRQMESAVEEFYQELQRGSKIKQGKRILKLQEFVGGNHSPIRL